MQRPSLLVSALLVAAASAALHGASPEAARADSFLILGGGMIFPLGDENWEDLAESSPTFFVRGGGGRKVQAHARLLLEGSFEVTPIATSLNDSAIADLDVSRYRALLGVRYEQRIGHAALISLRGGFGIDHLRGELTTPLGSDSDSCSASSWPCRSACTTTTPSTSAAPICRCSPACASSCSAAQGAARATAARRRSAQRGGGSASTMVAPRASAWTRMEKRAA